ncbi:hypothetical protein NKOR_05090 [Candidatus Nitrosopumilus koreensis AR1]|uniref:Uncharacterized protein n=1 Tax=Candidatus Nitrosopumilus koreensis AR1 TaxID=1229908 RepID=K0B637_9ARCH|nr:MULTISPECIES: hypothetical protein [Nitrosopumilus]AFS80904.1 hypothetical protein NKOR_05090 [Candidatus Nitrosopumilus koreensis AR1]
MPESQTDNFELFEKISKKYFVELEQNVPHIQQTLFDLQNEYYKVWKNYVNSNILLQKEFSTRSGFGPKFSDDVKEIIENMSDETIKFRSIFHKIAIANIEHGKSYAKTLNDNAYTFADLNKKIMKYWISVLSPYSNN